MKDLVACKTCRHVYGPVVGWEWWQWLGTVPIIAVGSLVVITGNIGWILMAACLFFLLGVTGLFLFRGPRLKERYSCPHCHSIDDWLIYGAGRRNINTGRWDLDEWRWPGSEENTTEEDQGRPESEPEESTMEENQESSAPIPAPDNRLEELRVLCLNYKFHTLVEHEGHVYGYSWNGPPVGLQVMHLWRGRWGWAMYHGELHRTVRVIAKQRLQRDLREALIGLETYDNDAAHVAGDTHDMTARRLRAILSVHGLKGDESPLVAAWTEVIGNALEKLQDWNERSKDGDPTEEKGSQ